MNESLKHTSHGTASVSMSLKGISSMATKSVLAQLIRHYEQKTKVSVQMESVGGVDASKRVQAGEPFDMVLLGSDAIDKLIASGHLISGSRQDWVQSLVAVAVKSGGIHPDVHNEESLKEAVLRAASLSYSTGPSGVYLEKLFERWGIAQEIRSKIIVPPPGLAVGTLIAKGEVALGFQQRSELLGVPGIEVLGNLPDEVAYVTTFSAGLPSHLKTDPQKVLAVKDFLDFLASQETLSIKKEQGMDGLQS